MIRISLGGFLFTTVCAFIPTWAPSSQPKYFDTYYRDGGLYSRTPLDEEGRPHGIEVRYSPTGEWETHSEFYHGQWRGACTNLAQKPQDSE